MEIKEIIAHNISELRKYKKWTQMELAEKLHYTDKAISKWERAESTPDVDALNEISKLFGVSIDYLFHEQKEGKAKFIINSAINWFKKMMMLFISVAVCLLIALTLFIVGWCLNWPNMWIAFVWSAVPINVLTWIFFRRIKNWLGSVISAAIVPLTVIAGIYFQLMVFPPYQNLWLLFIAVIPLSAVIILIYFKNFEKNKKKEIE